MASTNTLSLPNGTSMRKAPGPSTKPSQNNSSSLLPALRSPRSIKASRQSRVVAANTSPPAENFARLCLLYIEGGVMALRQTFNQIHPPALLSQHLSEQHKNLRRLKIQGVITPLQWDVLYPSQQRNRRIISSERYDFTLLVTLLKAKAVCKLSAPYPNGWDELPLDEDKSMAGDIVRLVLYRKALLTLIERGQIDSVDAQQFQVYWDQISGVIQRLGRHRSIYELIPQIQKQKFDEAAQRELIERLRSLHETCVEASSKEHNIHNTAQLRNSNSHDLARITNTNFKSRTAAPLRQGEETEEEEEEESGEEEEEEDTKPQYSKQAQLAREVEEEIIYEVARSLEKDILAKYSDEIITNIKSEDVLSRLVQRGILSHEEKNKISLTMRNTDRMRLVISCLATKPGSRAFDIFCDIIKFKHKGLYNKLVETKKAPLLIGRPDEASQMAEAVRNKYKAVFSKCVPIPWHDTLYAPIHDFFCQPYITDTQGRDVCADNLFSGYPGNESPCRILLEGSSGIGKSTFCRHLAYEWARGNITWDNRFSMVFLIDVHMIHKKNKDIEDVIMDQCLPFSFKKSKDEISAVLHKNQEHVLFILDGIENQQQIQAVNTLIYPGVAKYPHAAVLATINRNFCSRDLAQNFDTRLVLLGQHHHDQESLVRNYIRLTQKPIELFEPLLRELQMEQLQEEQEEMGDKGPQQNGAKSPKRSARAEQNGQHDEKNGNVFVLSLNPMYCLCLCLACEYKEISLHSCHTVTELMAAFTNALLVLYCERNHLLIQFETMPEEVTASIQVLEEIAFNCALNHMDSMPTESLRKQHKNTEFVNFGVMTVFLAGQRSRPVENCFFANSLFRDFMAARYLSRLEEEEFVDHTEHLVTDPWLHNISVFFSGIQHRDFADAENGRVERDAKEHQNLSDIKETAIEDRKLHKLFQCLADRNLNVSRGLSFLDDSRPATRSTKPPASAKTDSTVRSKSTSTSTTTSTVDSGRRLSDIQLNLECLYECNGQKEMMDLILDSMPTRVYMRQGDIPDWRTIQGLCQLLKSNEVVTELDLQLDHCGQYNIQSFRYLAHVIEKSTQVSVLRLHWTSDSMLALYLAQIFSGQNNTIHTLKITDEVWAKEEDGISAAVWTSFREARRGMRWLRTFAFRHCKNPAMISSIIRNIPNTLQHLDLNYCSLDLVSAQELAEKMEASERLRTLSLQDAEFDQVQFVHIAKGFKHSKSIVELNLSHTGIDKVRMKTLTEALTFNKSIRRLNLCKNTLDSVSCDLLAQILPVNKSLQEINLRECGLNEENKELMRNNKRNNTMILGINPRRPAASFYNGQ